VVRLKAVSVADFWNLSPGEAALILDDAMTTQIEQEKQRGGMNDDIRDRLDSRRAKLRAKGIDVQ
jgi:hypothetical protein